MIFFECGCYFLVCLHPQSERQMFSIPKTYKVIFICFVLIFRMLYLNLSFPTSENNTRCAHFAQTHQSLKLKRSRRINNVSTSHEEVVNPSDVFEENEEDSRLKISLPFIGIVLEKLFHSCHKSIKRISTLANPLLYASSPPYLTLQVIRI